MPTDPDRPPSFLAPFPCFSIHSSARLSPRLLRLPPRSTGISRLPQPEKLQETQRGREGCAEGQKGRPTGVIWRVREDLPNHRAGGECLWASAAGASQRRVVRSACSLSVVMATKSSNLASGGDFPSQEGGGVRCFLKGSGVLFLRARLRRAGNRTPGFYSRRWQRVSSSCGWSPNWYVCL